MNHINKLLLNSLTGPYQSIVTDRILCLIVPSVETYDQYKSYFLCLYEGRAKSSVTNRLPSFYPRYILKCFTALEWCVE